jgi:CDP-diacylglycerol--glycerol-3-phosphate 3-phosphatidyltransferase
MKWYDTLTLPNILTLTRLLVSPVTVPFLIVYLLPFNVFFINIVLSFVFLLFGLTDFFDGYYARKFGQVTQLGSTLDPIADKFLLCATLVALLAVQKIYFYWVILLIGREFFVMGLRLMAAEQKFSIPVSFLAKIKTCVEIFYIAIVILNPVHDTYSVFNHWNFVEYSLLLATLSLSLFTAYRYYIQFSTELLLKERVYAAH